MKVFVPVSEELMDKLGIGPDDLVPFDLDYEVLRPEILPASVETVPTVPVSTPEPA